ncbi:MAG: restriction endonuclease [Clostridiaceae bacterium]|nr:restriction endonuclease [Clostridiaceae bacterium]
MQRLFNEFNEHYKKYKKNRSNSRRFRLYYNQNKEDTRSSTAKIVDYVIWRIILFFGVLFMLYFRGMTIYTSTIIATLTLTGLHIVSIKLRSNRIEDLKKEKRRVVATQRIYKEIMNKTFDELKEYVEKIFSERGFNNIRHLHSDTRNILMEGFYGGEKIMISFYLHKNDYDVELKDIREFLCKVIEHDVKKGIVITTADFTQDSYNFIENINKNYKISLMNKELLMKIIEVNEMFPTEEEIDEIIDNKISKSEIKWQKYKTAAFSSKKIKGYVGLSIYLIITAFYIPYTFYYIVVASITLSLALISFILYLKKNMEKEEGENQEVKKIFENL